MRGRFVVAVLLFASLARGQAADGTAALVDLAVRRDAGIAAVVKRDPASVAPAVTVLLERAHRAGPSSAQSDLDAAEWIALTHARVRGDSSIARGVRAFRDWSREQRDRKLAADRLRRRANSALLSGGVSAAMPHWRESLRLASSIPDPAGIAAALGNIGAGFYRAGEVDSARVYLESSRRLADRIGEIRIAANAMTTLATLRLDRGEPRPALTLYRDALALRRRIGDVRGEVADRNNIGLVHQALGELDSARKSFAASLAQSRVHGLMDDAGLSLLNLGNLDAVAGLHSDAAAKYERALAAHRSTGNRLEAAGVLHNYGLLELRRGRYGAAVERLNESLISYDAIGSVGQRIEVRNDLASALLATGTLAEAGEQLRRIERIAGGTPSRSAARADLALTSAEIALQFNALGDAERGYAKAESLFRAIGDATGVAAAREGRAFLLLLRGEFRLARQVFEEIAAVHAGAGDRRAAGIARMLAGVAAHREHRFPAARRALDEALSDFRAVEDRVGEAATLGESASLYRSVGDARRSEASFRRALQLIEGRAPPISWRLHAGLGQLLQHARPAEAAAELRRSVTEIERISSVLTLSERRAAYMDDKWEVYATLARLEGRNGRPGAAFDMSERMRARQTLDLLARAPRPEKLTSTTSARRREASLRQQVAQLRSDRLTLRLDHRSIPDPTAGTGLIGRRSGELRNAEARHAQLLRQMAVTDPGYTALARGETISWREVVARLGPEEVLVEYLVSDSTTLAFVVRRTGVTVLDLRIAGGELASAIEFARASLADPDRRPGTMHWRHPLRRLHRELIAPLDRSGLLAGAQRLIVIPHAELHYLPFAALIRAGAEDRFLVEQYEIEYAPSASVWVKLGVRARSARDDRKVLALAPRRQSLVGSRAEVAAIRAGYGTRADVWTDSDASEIRFRSLAGQYGIIHLATAGVLDPRQPLLSFVALRAGGGEDGRLEVHEVFDLVIGARLVVLSACETALGAGSSADVPAGDDWVGLTQAFLQAGAANVLGTLWRVDDRATADVMTRFYATLRAGRSESASLAAAQRAAIRRPGTADPYYWAGFVMSGTGASHTRAVALRR